jgi:hypothetical protein
VFCEVTTGSHPVNDAPVAFEDQITVVEGKLVTALEEQLALANDTDTENNWLTMCWFEFSQWNTYLNSNGTFSYVSTTVQKPLLIEVLAIANDGALNSNIRATVSLLVTPVNDALNRLLQTNEKPADRRHSEEQLFLADTDVENNTLMHTLGNERLL